MRKYFALVTSSMLLLAALLLNPFGADLSFVWQTIVAVIFAIAITCFATSALFTPTVVAIFTLGLPIAVLGFVGSDAYGSWFDAAVVAARSVFSFHTPRDLTIYLPTAVALIIALIGRRLGPNNSFKPKPLRGSA